MLGNKKQGCAIPGAHASWPSSASSRSGEAGAGGPAEAPVPRGGSAIFSRGPLMCIGAAPALLVASSEARPDSERGVAGGVAPAPCATPWQLPRVRIYVTVGVRDTPAASRPSHTHTPHTQLPGNHQGSP